MGEHLTFGIIFGFVFRNFQIIWFWRLGPLTFGMICDFLDRFTFGIFWIIWVLGPFDFWDNLCIFLDNFSFMMKVQLQCWQQYGPLFLLSKYRHFDVYIIDNCIDTSIFLYDFTYDIISHMWSFGGLLVLFRILGSFDFGIIFYFWDYLTFGIWGSFGIETFDFWDHLWFLRSFDFWDCGIIWDWETFDFLGPLVIF